MYGNTIYFVTSPLINEGVIFPGMIKSIEVRDFGQKRTGIFRERMDSEAINTEPQDLVFVSQVVYTCGAELLT